MHTEHLLVDPVSSCTPYTMTDTRLPPSRLYTIIKLVDKIEWAEDICAGKLRAGTLGGYRSYQDANGELRGDEYEGIAAWSPSSAYAKLEVDGVAVDYEHLAIMSDNSILNCNAFCAYALKEQPQELSLEEFRDALRIHRQCFGLGAFAVVMTKFREFLKRVRSATEKLGAPCQGGFVEYFDETAYSGSFSRPGFAKRMRYSHQNEYRILWQCSGEPRDPRIIDVGDISDITIIRPADTLDELITVGWAPAEPDDD